MADSRNHPPPRAPPESSPSTRDSAIASPRTSLDSRSPPSRNPSLRLGTMPSAASQHRQSFSESLRGHPPSPRSQRQLSLSQAAVQELIDNPPARNADPAFTGRDWRSISIAELVSPEELRFVEVDTGVEAATNVGSAVIRSSGIYEAYWFFVLASDRFWCPCSPHPRNIYHQICHRHLRLYRPQRVPPSCRGTGSARRRTHHFLP